MRLLKSHWVTLAVYCIALVPLAIVAWQYFNDLLSANPIRDVQLITGKFTLSVLILTLACTPIYNIFGFKPALWLRGPLGFITVTYAFLHFLAFIALDYRFDLLLIWEDSSGKRYIWVGLTALIILLGLALISIPEWRMKLGRNWKRIQRFIYIAAILGALHFVWSAKADLRLPLFYTGIILLLLILRLPPIAYRIRVIRRRG